MLNQENTNTSSESRSSSEDMNDREEINVVKGMKERQRRTTGAAIRSSQHEDQSSSENPFERADEIKENKNNSSMVASQILSN